MLPKPDKSKKTTTEQLDLVNTISADDRIRHKRRLLIIILILTFGLSFSFWLYTSLKSFSTLRIYSALQNHFSFPEINLPTFSSSKTFNPNLNLDSNSWSIYLSTDNFTWSKNYDLSTPSPIISDLQKLTPAQNSFIKSALPEGAEIKERITESQDSFELQSLVTIPKKQILFLIKVTGSNLDSSKSLIPSVASTLYWSLMQSN